MSDTPYLVDIISFWGHYLLKVYVHIDVWVPCKSTWSGSSRSCNAQRTQSWWNPVHHQIRVSQLFTSVLQVIYLFYKHTASTITSHNIITDAPACVRSHWGVGNHLCSNHETFFFCLQVCYKYSTGFLSSPIHFPPPSWWHFVCDSNSCLDPDM